jgi:hypothetical protein
LSATRGHTSATFIGGRVTRESLSSRRAPRRSSEEPDGAYPAPTSNPLRGANPVGRHNSLSGGDPRQNTWSPHIEQVSRRTAQRMGLLGPLLNRRSELSVRNGVLLYKLLIRPMMHYACPVWRLATRTLIRRLQILKSKCLRLVTGAPWYLSNRQIHEDLGVTLFADRISGLTTSFDSRLADVVNPLFRQLGRYLH